MVDTFARFLFWISSENSEDGQAYVEYVVLGAIAVFVLLAAVQYFFGGVSALFERMGDSLRGLQ